MDAYWEQAIVMTTEPTVANQLTLPIAVTANARRFKARVIVEQKRNERAYY